MSKKEIYIATLFIIITLFEAYAQQVPQFGINTNSEVLAAMTLEEKVNLVVGTSKTEPLPPPAAPGTDKVLSKAPYNSANTYIAHNRVEGAAGDSYAIPRLGIPSIVFADGPAGLRISPARQNDARQYYASGFPIATLLASSWDLDLVNNIGKAMGNEVLLYGVDIILAPGINIHRNPLTGRNFEYYSEDPVLAGRLAAAMIDGIQSNGVGTSIKHYAVNNQETYRNGIDARVSERALREIYLKGFEIALRESQPWTVMSSYNKVNGEYASESSKLLTKILRGEFGFSGFVMTDWWGASDPIAQMRAGNDMLMPGHDLQIEAIIEGVRNGSLDEKILDKNVLNILNIIEKSPSGKNYIATNDPDLKAHGILIRTAASEGMVLLENKNNTLPLPTTLKSVALLGVGSYRTTIGGHGSGYVHSPYKISLSNGLYETGLLFDMQTAGSYKKYIEKELEGLPQESFWYVPTVPEMKVSQEELFRLAKDCDVAIITINRNSGEGEDRKLDKGDYYLTDLEKSLIIDTSKLFKEKGKKVIVVLNVGGVIEMGDWKDYPDAILLAWQPGQEAGNSIADVLLGKVNPSGKLPTTFTRKYEDVPSATNFPWSNKEHNKVEYKEGVFVGYRHYTTNKVKPQYEFGYGLSYTKFEYTGLSVTNDVTSDQILISFEVRNIGVLAGKEATQLYVTAPKGSIEKPSIELKAFGKTKLLQPGEKQILHFKVNKSDLGSYNESQSAWVVDHGEYTFYAASSSQKLILSKNIKL